MIGITRQSHTQPMLVMMIIIIIELLHHKYLT